LFSPAKERAVKLNPDISKIKKTKHFQNMGLCPIAPPKGFPIALWKPSGINA
jgi:hypothetical protein